MRIDPDISGLSIVLRGNFSPAVYTPAWFALNGFLPRSVAENASVQNVSSNQSLFTTDWLHLHVTGDRFQASSESGPVIRVRDFVVRVFIDHLHRIPIHALGINWSVHFCAPSRKSRDRVARELVPVEPWRACSDALNLDCENDRLWSLTMAGLRPEGTLPHGRVSVTVEPSRRTGLEPLGIYVSINDHYDVDTNVENMRAPIGVLSENEFALSEKRRNTIVNHIMSLAIDEGGSR